MRSSESLHDLSGDPLLAAMLTPGSAEHAFAVEALGEYFATFSGRDFERLPVSDHDRVEPIDLVAVSLLGVNIDGKAALALLHDRSDALHDLLRQVPQVALQDVKWSVLRPGSPADQLWAALHDVPGMGPTTVGKLLARKRPRLLPVFDERVYRRMGSPRSWWEFHWTWWDDEEHVAQVVGLRASVGGIDDVSLLRVWDVAVWSLDRALVPRTR